MNESWGNIRHRHTRKMEHRTLKVDEVLSVAEGAPQLAGWVGQWVPASYAGRACKVRVLDSVTVINGEAHVKVERPFPFTGGVMPVSMIAIPEPMSLMIRPPMAIVVWTPKEKTAYSVV